MSNQAKQYFLAPSWDYPPNGPIALGNILLSPTEPIRPPLVLSSTIPHPITSTKHNVSWSRDTTTTHRFGIWTKFIEFLGVNIGFETGSSSHDTFRFESMRTEEFYPDEAFLRAAMDVPAVKRRVVRLRKAVFVVVGVKTVSGAVIRRGKAGEAEVVGEVGVDVGLVRAVLAKVRPAVRVAKERRESWEFEGGDDFVFAFRVLKVE